MNEPGIEMNLFENRNLVIATKHSKESVIAPIVEKEIGARCFVTQKFDTDSLGTFTGEIERQDDPIKTLRKKCIEGMNSENCDLGIASEGSFGPHPGIFFAAADEEMMIFIDRKNDIEIIANEISTETNFSGSEVRTENELLAFATQVDFPSHALILRASADDKVFLKKGINNHDDLIKNFNEISGRFGSAFVETDMRAMHNPMRLKVIEKVTHRLITKIKSLCPQCNHPGYSVTDVLPGLPCGLCGYATNSTLSHIYTCRKCSHKTELKYPHQKTFEDPMYCDLCNP